MERFLGLVHHHVTARAPIQIHASNHVIAELAEPRIGANVLSSHAWCDLGHGNNIASSPGPLRDEARNETTSAAESWGLVYD